MLTRERLSVSQTRLRQPALIIEESLASGVFRLCCEPSCPEKNNVRRIRSLHPTDYLQASRDIADAVLRCAATTEQALFMAVIGLGLSMVLSGCALSYETTKSPRAPSEQLLLTQSLKRSLIDAVLPLRPGQTIAVETVG